MNKTLKKSMDAKNKPSCVLIGQTTLPQACGEILLENEFSIRAVMSDDERMIGWAGKNGILCLSDMEELAEYIRTGEIDYLFSIINPKILDEAVLNSLSTYAINYHDSPLPRYAGSYATSWAIINGEEKHSVTWHQMAGRLDAGDVLRQNTFAISPDETALTLNAKCYTAAISSFTELVKDILNGHIDRKSQDLSKRTFYRRTDRPLTGCTLSWDDAAEALSRTFRALQFGPYPNHLGLPKVLLGNDFFLIDHFQVTEIKSIAKPGTIQSITSNEIVVSTTTHDVVIADFRTIYGAPVSIASLAADFDLLPGIQLPALSKEQASLLNDIYAGLCGFEHFWVERLQQAQPATICNGTGKKEKKYAFERYSIEVPLKIPASFKEKNDSSEDFWISIFAIFLAKITGVASFDIGFIDSSRQSAIQEIGGFFSAVVPLRISIDVEASAMETIDRICEEIAHIRKHGTYALDITARYPELRNVKTENFETWPVIVQAAYEGDHASIATNNKSDGHRIESASGAHTSWNGGTCTCFGSEITLRIDGNRCHWLYSSNDLTAEQIGCMAKQFSALAHGIISDCSRTVASLSLLTDEARHRCVFEWNDTAVVYPKIETIHQLFEAQVESTPDNIAVVFEGEKLTYAQLNARANRLAHYLRSQGVEADSLVGICAERSLEMLVGLLAVLKAGGAYVPFDPTYPKERFAFLLDDAKPSVLLTQKHLQKRLPDIGKYRHPVIFLMDEQWGELDNFPLTNPQSNAQANNIAYVIYTSGSTGKPKGVEVEHGGVVNRLQWMQEVYLLDEKDSILQKTPYTFDVSVWEFFWPIANGARLVFAKPEGHQDPQYLCHLIALHGITTMHFVPPMLDVFLGVAEAGRYASLRRVICSGEALPFGLQQRFFSIFPNTELHNLYGPTEASIDVTFWQCKPDSALPFVPIGRPIANTQIYILDAKLDPVPPGVSGELYIAGKGLARGYLNRPELTAEKFVSNPFSASTAARMYRSGDLARYLPDGTIEYLGRLDHQVKIRGFRIELGEIEATLVGDDAIEQAVVVARERNDGNKYLVAYLVPGKGKTAPKPDMLRKMLLRLLPEYMVPAYFVVLDEIPLTLNGKIDRKSLPAPDISRGTEDYVPPRTSIESALSSMWASILGLEKVGIYDDFFSLGGDSLLATQVIAKIRSKWHIDLPLRALFETNNVSRLSERIQENQSLVALAAPPILPVGRHNGQKDFPLSFAQQRLWFLDQFEPGGSFYNLPTALLLKGRLDKEALQYSLNEIVRRHEALRTIFVMTGDVPRQVILPRLVIQLPVVDLRDFSAAERESEAERIIQESANSPFDLATGPLIRARLVSLSHNEHTLIITIHHIISDGWSTKLLVDEMAILYRSYIQNHPSPLPELAIQYADFAEWQRAWLKGDALRRQIQYWAKYLSGAPTLLSLPTDRPRPVIQSHNGATLEFTVPAATTAALNALSKKNQSTLFMTLAAAFNILLARYSGQKDICIGTPIANRNRTEVDSLIGFFVNTLVLRTKIDESLSFEELLEQTRQNALDAYAHQDIPFEQLVEAINPERQTSHSPLFQVMLALQSTPIEELDLPGLTLQPVSVSSKIAKFDLTLSVTESMGKLIGLFEYNTDLLDVSTAQRMITHFMRLLEAIVATPDVCISELEMLSHDEKSHLLVEWNRTAYPYPENQTLEKIFDAQAEKNPNHLAIISEGKTLSYADLRFRAKCLGRRISLLDGRPNALIAVVMEKGWEQVVASLGVLYAGCAYLPIDPELPTARLHYILTHASASVVLTQSKLHQKIRWPSNITACLCVDEDIDDDVERPLSHFLSMPDDLAYVIYTSGSTGLPKGVMIDHRGAVNTLSDINRRFKMTPDDRVFALSSLSFDLSVFDIFGTLAAGATIVIPEHEKRADPAYWQETLAEHGVTVWNSVPALLSLLVEHADQTGTCLTDALRLFMLSGDWIPINLPDQLWRLLPNAEVVSLGGATEASIWSIYFPIEEVRSSWRSIPYGKPLSNQRFYVLDASLNPTPIGVVGELYIGGIGLAKGYWGDKEKTEHSFIYHASIGERLYRTGDIGRHSNDGCIEFLGRLDNQVKINGFRIELGEIEVTLQKHKDIEQAVVLAREDIPGHKRLVAYLTAPENRAVPEPEALREMLLQSLPDYMVPSHFIAVEEMPLTSNGKVDRKALPVPSVMGNAEKYVAPRTPTEAKLAEIWEGVLGIDKIGIHDNFFVIGGHSLLATQVISKARSAWKIHLPLRSIFEATTIALFARKVDSLRSETVDAMEKTIAIADKTREIPLSFPQQRLWFLDQFQPGSVLYNIPGAYRLTGKFDTDAFNSALNTIIHRHEVLRTTFASFAGAARQIVLPELSVNLPIINLSQLAPSEAEAAAQELILAEANRAFDLTSGPLIRGQILALGTEDHILLLTMHHIVSDGWSIEIFLQELAILYGDYVRNKSPSIPDLTIQYADFAQWQRHQVDEGAFRQQLQYWKTHLAGASTLLTLPTDRPRPAMQRHVGAALTFNISKDTTASLKKLGHQNNCTLFMTLAAAFNILLSRYSGQNDICIGTPIANRNRVEVEPLIGFFVNTLVLRLQVLPNSSVQDLLQHARTISLAAYANQDVPFEQLVEILNPERHTSHSPLFQVMLMLQNTPAENLTLPGLQLSRMQVPRNVAKFDLTLEIKESDGQLHSILEYDTDLFDHSTVERMARHFTCLLDAITAAAPDTPIEKLSMLSSEERRKLLVEWNGREVDYPRTKCIHELFEAQVERNPDAIATIYGETRLTYRELNGKANQLAHYLAKEKSIRPDSLVGICVDRSPAMVIAILAVLKAGGAYVPLDPDYPAARLAYMFEDACLAVVITQLHLSERLPIKREQSLCLDDPEFHRSVASQRTDNIEKDKIGLLSHGLAYVMYTSGSTGKPKGVRGEHSAIVNRLCWMERYISLSANDVFCLKTSIAFVDHIAEIFQPLICGNPLVVLLREQAGNPVDLIRAIAKQKISRITLVPSLLWALLQEEIPENLTSLRYVISSGEPLTLRVVKAFHRKFPHVSLINLYGATEVGADATVYEIASLYGNPDVMRYFLDRSEMHEKTAAKFGSDGYLQKENENKRKTLTLKEVAECFSDTAIPDRPITFEQYIEAINENIIPNLVDVSSSHYIGHMTSKLPSFIPDLSQLIVKLNQNVVKIETSKGMTFIERQVLASMHRLFYGFHGSFYEDHCQDRKHVFGVVTSGGSISNVTALWYARNRAILKKGISKDFLLQHGFSRALHEIGFKKGVILGTRLLHYSIKKAISLFGVGQDSFIEVMQDGAQRMSIEDLEYRIGECQKEGYLVLAIIGIAGATETGTVDPLEKIAAIAKKHDIHFHVDAAWGGAFQFSGKYKHKLAGIEYADSITLCPHKQLFLPQGISICLFKDTEGIGAISTHAEYQAQEGSFDLGQFTLEGSRPANALFLHASLNVISGQGYEWLIDQSMEKVGQLLWLIENSTCFELVGGYPELNIVNYRYIPCSLRAKKKGSYTRSENDKISEAVDLIQQHQFTQGRSFVSRTKILASAYSDAPISVFRVVLSNPLTTLETLQEVLNDQIRIAHEYVEYGKGDLHDSILHLKTSPEMQDYNDWFAPIGKPIDNARIYVLDAAKNLVPCGVVGEIYVGGECLARNYLNKPEETENRFLTDPFHDRPGARMYRTGDLGRWSPEGILEYVGRVDHQVKIRGFRIELGEIESALFTHDSVKNAVVSARDISYGDKQLVAYVVAHSSSRNETLLIEDLRQHLEKSLPEYMMPSAFVLLESLPLNPNGKVDRNALPAPSIVGTGEEYVAPRTEVEEKLAEIWKNILRLEKVGVHDNFFRLGGHSLLSVQLVRHLGEHGIKSSVQQIYKTPTIGGLAASLRVEGNTRLSESRSLVTGRAPLMANHYWFLKRHNVHHWNASTLWELLFKADVEILKSSIAALLEHHDGLRRVFGVENEKHFQIFQAPEEMHKWWYYVDLSNVEDECIGPAIERHCSEFQSSLNIYSVLFKVVYFDLGRHRNGRLFFVIHQVLLDPISIPIFYEDLLAIYSDLSMGKAIALPDKTASIKKWSEWQERYAGEEANSYLSYWRSRAWGKHQKFPEERYPEELNNELDSTVECDFVFGLLTEEETAMLQNVVIGADFQIDHILLTALILAYEKWTGSPALFLLFMTHGRIVKEADGMDLSRTVGWLPNYSNIMFALKYGAKDAQFSAKKAICDIRDQMVQLQDGGLSFTCLRHMNPDPEIRKEMGELPEYNLEFTYTPRTRSAEKEMDFLKMMRPAPEPSGPNDARMHSSFPPFGKSYYAGDQLKIHWGFSPYQYSKRTMGELVNNHLYFIRKLIRECTD